MKISEECDVGSRRFSSISVPLCPAPASSELHTSSCTPGDLDLRLFFAMGIFFTFILFDGRRSVLPASQQLLKKRERGGCRSTFLARSGTHADGRDGHRPRKSRCTIPRKTALFSTPEHFYRLYKNRKFAIDRGSRTALQKKHGGPEVAHGDTDPALREPFSPRRGSVFPRKSYFSPC